MDQPLKIVTGLFVASALIFAHMPEAMAQTTNADFQQAVAEYQKSPSVDGADKVIKLAVAMGQLPPVPEEARRHYVIAMTLLKDAKKIEDFGEAIGELKSALLVAPWWPEANLRLGMALEGAEKYDEAMRALKLYLLTGPTGEAARAAQDEIYIIEAKQKKAAKESSPEAVVAKKQDTYEEWLKNLNGRKYTCPQPVGKLTLEVKGKVLFYGCNRNNGYREEAGRFEITGREISPSCPSEQQQTAGGLFTSWITKWTFTFSEDGERITQRMWWNKGSVTENLYLWEK